MDRFAQLNFKIIWGQCPQTPILGRGYGAPSHTLPPRHSGASRLRASLGAFGPSIVPLCVYDILIYFRQCEAVVLHLIRTKCLPILLYGVESCPMIIQGEAK